jgi:sulfate/thiosulfate transport system ATP-binding protein
MTVRVERLNKRFSGQVGAAAVDDVSFDAKSGVITTLLGPSGSGKSTLLRVIAGLERPDSGNVLINGLDSTRVSPRQRNVGFVFQNYALFRHMTVFENIAFGMRVRGRGRDEVRGRVEELLELVQLSSYATRFPGQLSGGQRQRVALARALATNPQVLLLDEPFGALDARVRVELREWLLGFQERAGVTTIMVTHDQEEALELSDHVVLLNAGRVEQAGTPHDLYDKPASPFVASFLGGASILEGTVQSGRAAVGSLEVRAPDGVPDGVSVRALIRPHDVRLAKTGEGGLSLARVDRMRRIGPSVKLLLELSNGEPMTVTMAKAEIDDLGIRDGDKVFVDLRRANVFVSDYSI